ncbi:hypothetical protein HPB48_010253 [Haemaphysalis longicornis]|uniref:Uncharacterized protein n=1 Tax=Haemaphysalis longicornis TaxID=44386 RepID=A0A9J6GQS8_HAELO|nr:hypothetical protein HPB48_010253 [Haemaphysalis longicornis]
MGRSRRKYNAKARSSQHTESSDKEKPPEVEVELDVRQDKYDSSNALILPSKKAQKKDVKKAKDVQVAPKLSKKKKKLLQKILEKKNKKINPEEKKGVSQISSVKGSRRFQPKRARIQRDDVLGFDSEESSESEQSEEGDDCAIA